MICNGFILVSTNKPMQSWVKSLPNKMLDSSNMKVFADNKVNVTNI